MSSSTVRTTGKRWEDMLKMVSDKRVQLTVGVHEAEAGTAKEVADGEPASKATLGDVAFWNEYGTEHIPSRSFIRAWFDETESENLEAAKKIFAAAAVKGRSVIQGMNRLGLLFVGQIQARIAGGIAPANAQSTIDRKGSSTPLINTGQLRSSIRHKVTSE